MIYHHLRVKRRNEVVKNENNTVQNPARAIVALLPWLIFWLYDTNFLKAEREYRELYEWLINHRLNNEKYLLDVDRKNFKKRFKSKVPCYSQTMLSTKQLVFYGTLFAIIIGATYQSFIR